VHKSRLWRLKYGGTSARRGAAEQPAVTEGELVEKRSAPSVERRAGEQRDHAERFGLVVEIAAPAPDLL